MRRLALGLAAVLALAPAAAPQSAVAPQAVAITATPITAFRIGRTDTRFGPLTFEGGLELTGSSWDFGALSSLRFRDNGSRFVGVADSGFWFWGRVLRDSAGHPTGFSDFSMQAMTDDAGRADALKWDVDAESLAIRGDTAYVGFERKHRVARYALSENGFGPPLGLVPLPIPLSELRMNRSLECLAVSPDGHLVTVTEKSVDANDDLFAAVLEGPARGVFKVKRHDPFDVSDCAFLPNGDLLLLERSFSIAQGVGMRLRRLPAAALKAGALADGPILMTADMGDQIDNMEGLDVWREPDGRLRLSMVSDDNHSILQRTLYLEFTLDEAGAG